MSDSPLAISIDPEFRRMVYPLPILEYRRLENDIIQNGCVRVRKHQIVDFNPHDILGCLFLCYIYTLI